MNLQTIKDNWFLIVAAAAAFAAYVEWRVNDTVDVQVHSIDAVDTGTLALLQKDVETIAEGVEDNKERHEKVDNKLDKIIDILLAE